MAITSTATTHSAPIRRNATSRPPTTLQLLRETLSQDAAQPSPAPATAHIEGAPGPGPGFSERQVALLSAPLDRAHVRQREQGRGRVSYLEGWQVIAEANRIFGFDGWERCTLISRCVAEHERPIGRDRKSGWGVTYTARVRITVTAGHRTLIREGSGAGHGIDADKGLAHESALKEAETDATKRALMTFGNPFGLALYDKQQRQVSDAKPAVTAKPTPAAPQNEKALEPTAITALQERIKALAPARLEAFSKGFRAAFQVPEAQPSLAGLITTSRHQRWIESFLADAPAA
ncbi:RAD52 family DNA repair protein [Synechococcus sp. CB0205]|uniref:RAD52 family DNA repair protein n=1 Tax=Synechococcus sp. CB0205 TaxID=232363 RepID=UPI000496C6D4|nr:RAD52 family DNA repair protein [Synechococcus sp. CB0205]